MDNMLPSPGFSIPSIGTPLHQPDEDQQILPNALQQQQESQQQSQFQMQSQMHSMNSMQSNMLMQTPPKAMHSYAMSQPFATPHSMMQPQTPVCVYTSVYHYTMWKMILILLWKDFNENPIPYCVYQLSEFKFYVLNVFFFQFVANSYVSTHAIREPTWCSNPGTRYSKSHDADDSSICRPWYSSSVTVSFAKFF